MVARLQQCITLGLLIAAAAWSAFFWRMHPVVAISGALVILFGFALILALEFVLLALRHGEDPTPRASATQLIAAWWAEACLMPRVFFWRQPFRADAESDFLPPRSAGRGVVLVHGLFCNRGFWTPWMQQLRELNHAFVAVNLEPAWGSLDVHADALEQAVRQVAASTGQPPVLICHSMGGLVARAWLASAGGAARVHRVVTIGSPHGGAWLARLSPTVHGRQMGLTSEWLQDLQALESARDHGRFVCWYSNADNIVFPPSTASLPSADNRFVPNTAHVALGFHPHVMAQSMALLRSSTRS